jgi:acetoin utilization deacetylase AcuC-like enzyme
MSTVLFTHPAGLDHDTGAGHPECPDRLRAVLAALAAPAFAGLTRREAPRATRVQLERAHPAAHIDAILGTTPATGTLVPLDPDTIMSAGSAQAALLAAGGACAAVDAVMSGAHPTAFAALRPPGHHAEPARAMGFCLFGNAAIAALHARAAWGVQRVAVVDFDVHHGNGTQAMAWDDPDFFFASSHQSPCYPGTGDASETGAHANIVNAPLAPGSGSGPFRAAWERVILPALQAFDPGLIIVSAGFDAHRDDPLAQLELEVADFAWVTGAILSVAGGRLVSVLEGGDDLKALGASAAAHTKALMEAGTRA